MKILGQGRYVGDVMADAKPSTVAGSNGMIHRVADAMMKADWDGEREPPPNAKISNYYAMARASIAAMRTPTDSECQVWEKFAPQWDHATAPPRLFYPLGSGPLAHWWAMIDAALIEPNK